MMSTDRLKAISADSSEEPEPADDGRDESLNTGREKPPADAGDDAAPDSADADASPDTTGSDDTGPAQRLRRRLVRMLACVILPAAGPLLGGAAGYLNLVSRAKNPLSRPLVWAGDSHMAISALEWWAA
jgi:hypothetical protein